MWCSQNDTNQPKSTVERFGLEPVPKHYFTSLLDFPHQNFNEKH